MTPNHNIRILNKGKGSRRGRGRESIAIRFDMMSRKYVVCAPNQTRRADKDKEISCVLLNYVTSSDDEL